MFKRGSSITTLPLDAEQQRLKVTRDDEGR
jgi:hypothetical protein